MGQVRGEGRWRGCVGQVRGREDGGAVWGR